MRLGIDLWDLRSEHRGGKDEVALNLVRGFVSLGHTGEIVCFCRKETVPVLRSIDPDLRTVVLKYDEAGGMLLKHLKRTLNGFRLREAVRSSGTDVLLFTNKYTPNLRFPVKTAMITHDLQCFSAPVRKQSAYIELRRRNEQREIRNDFRNRDLIVAISDFDASMCREFIPEYAGKVRRIYNPVSFPDISPGPACRKELSGKYVTALNIQWGHKNPMTLIRAFERVRDAVPLDLALVGRPSPDTQELTRYVREHHLEDRVVFTGFVSESELEEIIAQTRIYVNPSFFEGFGLTAVEMLYHGIPSIVADCTASPETTAGYAALYSPPDDDAALARAILQEWNDPVPPEKRAEASAELKKRYDRSTIAAQYWDALAGLAADTDGPEGPSAGRQKSLKKGTEAV